MKSAVFRAAGSINGAFGSTCFRRLPQRCAIFYDWCSLYQAQKAPTGAVPPPNYLCHRCNQPGHFIGDCPPRLEDGAGAGEAGSRGGGTRGRGVPARGYVCPLVAVK